MIGPDRFEVGAPDGHRIPAYAWGLRGPTVVVAHGFGDHGRALPYQRLAAALTDAGCRLVSFDHRGHGEVRGLLPSVRWHHIVNDLVVVRDAVAARDAASPALVGLSMGALAVLDLAIAGRAGSSRLVAVAAPVGRIGASRVAVLAGRMLSRIWPTARVHLRLNLQGIAADTELVRAYTSDPLFHQDMRAGLGAGILDATERVRSGAATLRTSVTMLHGLSDRLAVWDDRFARSAPAGCVRARLFEGARHNLFLEGVADEVFREIAAVARQD